MNKKGTVLIVDDELDLLETMRFRLEAADYEVITLLEGKKTIEIAEKIKPDLIILDIMLPGISGFDVLQKLKKNSETKEIPILIFSCGGEEEAWAKKSLDLGAAGYVVKPFDGDSLLFTVNKFIKKKS